MLCFVEAILCTRQIEGPKFDYLYPVIKYWSAPWAKKKRRKSWQQIQIYLSSNHACEIITFSNVIFLPCI